MDPAFRYGEDYGRKRPAQDFDDQESSRKRYQVDDGTTIKGILIKLMVPNAASGSVIGRQGSIIMQASQRSGARIKLSQNREFYPGTSDRVLSIVGSKESIRLAYDEMVSRIAQADDKPPSDHDSRPPPKPTHVIRLLIPWTASGAIIGKAGCIVRHITEEAGCRIQLDDGNDRYATRERIVTITSNTFNGMMKGSMMVLAQLLLESTNFTYLNPSITYNQEEVYPPAAVRGHAVDGDKDFQKYVPPGEEYRGKTSEELLSGYRPRSPDTYGGSRYLPPGQVHAAEIGRSELYDPVSETGMMSKYGSGTAYDPTESFAPMNRNGYDGDTSLPYTSASSRYHSSAAIIPLSESVGYGEGATQFAEPSPRSSSGYGSYTQASAYGASMHAQNNARQTVGYASDGPVGREHPVYHAADVRAAAAAPMPVVTASHQQSPARAPAASATSSNPPAPPVLLGADITPPVYTMEGDIVTMELGVPDNKLGAILGYGGSVLREIVTQSKTNIQISQKDQYIPGTRNRSVKVVGNLHQVYIARSLIFNKLNAETLSRERGEQTYRPPGPGSVR